MELEVGYDRSISQFLKYNLSKILTTLTTELLSGDEIIGLKKLSNLVIYTCFVIVSLFSTFNYFLPSLELSFSLLSEPWMVGGGEVSGIVQHFSLPCCVY